MSALRPTEYKVYTVRIYDAHDMLTGKMILAAEDRKRAQDAGVFWAQQRGMTGYRVSVMRQILGGTPQTMLVVTG